MQLSIALLGALGSQQYNVAIFVLGFWALYSDLTSALQTYMAVLAISMLADLVWFSVFGAGIINGEYDPVEAQQFGLSMDIINLILKPAAIILCYRAVHGH